MSDELWLHLISDVVIALSYFFIAFVLAYFLKRRADLTFKSAFVMLGLFIMLGGFIHVLNIMMIWAPVFWTPTHWVDDMIRMVTAFASLTAAVALWSLLPKALALPNLSVLLVRSREIQEKLRRDITAAQRAEQALFEEKERCALR